MSNSYDTNDFGEVVRYTHGRLTGERRDLTEYEEQLIEQAYQLRVDLDSTESNRRDLEEENAKLKAEVEELKTEISIMSNYSDQYMPNEHLQEMYSELEKEQSEDQK